MPASKKNNKIKSESNVRKARKGRKTFSRKYVYILVGVVAILLTISIYYLYPFIRTYTLMLNAKYGNVEYPSGEIRGIDVSRYQEEIDWDSLRTSDLQGVPVSFVFIKATEGKDIVDRYFKYNFYKSRMNGIVRGAYHFYSTLSSAKEQAHFFCRTVQLEEGDLPPVLDVETIGNLTKDQLQSELITWLNIVEDYYKIKPIIYSSHSFYKDKLNNPVFDSYPLWIAHYYIDSLRYNGDWRFWQHTDYGKVGGIDGFVDVNLFNGTYEELLDMTIKPAK